MTVSGNMIVNIEGGSPWGFRLQGGGNFPLQVIKIRKRSKSHRHLIEGDIIIRVNGIPVQGKTHEAVMDMVDATTGNNLNLEIYRGESLQKIPKKAPVATPWAAVAPASKTSTTSSVQMSEHTQHQQTTEESMYQNRISKQQMSQQSSSVLQEQQHHQQQYMQQQQHYQQQQQQQQQHHQQQQKVAKSNLVLQKQVQPQQRVTQIQQSSQWQESSSHEQTQQQQTTSVQQQQMSLQHQQMMAEHQQLNQQQFAEQQMARQQLAQQRQMAQQQHQQHSEQQSSQMMSSTSSSMFEQHESSHEEHTTNVSTALWTSGQSTSLDEKQTDLAQHAYKPYKPKVASHLPLREPPFTPVKPSPPPPSPAPATPTFADDKENMAPSPVPKPQVPPPNIPQFNVKNLKNLANQDWNEAEVEELDLPIPDYSKRMVIPPRPPEETTSPEMIKKTIEIPDMTLRPAPPVAPKPKRVLAEVQPEPEADVPDHVLIPIYTEDRPHLPVFGPPVVYGLHPALAPTGSTSVVEEESIISEASSGSRKNDPYLEIKKQKIYSDSSFYYDPSGVYPTIEEQIDLCKKISQSLTAAANSRARGATMFAKRQKRSEKWIHAGGYSDGNVADLEDLCSELDPSEGGTKPLFQFRIPRVAQQISTESPPKMSLSREEFETLRLSQPKVDHTAINPNTCMNIVADLQTSKGRGAKLFAKRQARCDKYVVDEQTSMSAPTTPSEPPQPPTVGSPSVAMMNAQNRLADMITKPIPIIQPKVPPQPAPKPHMPDVHAPVNKHIGVPLPTVNADLQAEFKNVCDGPNFNRTARGWKSVSFMPQPSRPQRAQSVQPQLPPPPPKSSKGPPPPVAPKPGKCMKPNPRPKLWMGDAQLPVHYRSSSDQMRLLSPGDPYHDASGYCSDVDHRTKAYSFKKPGMFRPSPYFAAPRMTQPVGCHLPGTDL